MSPIALCCLLTWPPGAAQDADAPLKALLAQAGQAHAEEARRLRADVRRRLLDLPPARVRDLLGHPKSIARQILYRRYLEQWTYDRPVTVVLVFHCPRGQEPRLRDVRWAGPEKP
jgi:hypothetical protein